MVGTFLVWYVGGRDVLFGRMSLETLMAFLMYVAMFYRPIRFMSQLINWSSRSLTAAERVFEIFDVRPEIQDAKDAVAIPEIQGRVEFRNVTFGYEPNKPVLKNINFEVKPGEMIGLVGHSGAGKSTSINLLCRFYDVDEGEILIDGEPIRQIRLEYIRRQTGIVPQDMFLCVPSSNSRRTLKPSKGSTARTRTKRSKRFIEGYLLLSQVVQCLAFISIDPNL